MNIKKCKWVPVARHATRCVQLPVVYVFALFASLTQSTHFSCGSWMLSRERMSSDTRRWRTNQGQLKPHRPKRKTKNFHFEYLPFKSRSVRIVGSQQDASKRQEILGIGEFSFACDAHEWVNHPVDRAQMRRPNVCGALRR